MNCLWIYVDFTFESNLIVAMAHSPKVIGGGAFVSPFEWNENSTVIIKYKHGGGHIRAHPHNHELCDHKGGQTEWAKWKVHLSDNGRIVSCQIYPSVLFIYFILFCSFHPSKTQKNIKANPQKIK